MRQQPALLGGRPLHHRVPTEAAGHAALLRHGAAGGGRAYDGDPGTKAYGVLSVWVQLYTTLVRARPLSRTIFYPQPHVDSSLVVLDRLPAARLPTIEPLQLRKVIQAGFSQRRKTLVNCLSAGLVSRGSRRWSWSRAWVCRRTCGPRDSSRGSSWSWHSDCYDGGMEAVKKAPAKVNLCLLVGPKNEEGFHELFTVFAPIDLYDTLDIKLKARPAEGSAGDLKVKCRAAEGESNLAFKALKMLEAETGWAFDGRIEIEKRIPVGGGLGGGSSDGACALLAGVEALSEAGGPVLDYEQQVAMARKVGADVAFFLKARPAIGRGIGEILGAHRPAGTGPGAGSFRQASID